MIMIENFSDRLRIVIAAGAMFGLVVAPGSASLAGEIAVKAPVADPLLVIEVTQDQQISPQRAMTGTGKSAGAAAGQSTGNKRGFLNTTVIIGVVIAGATVAVALKATGDDDSISPTTTTN